MGVWRIAAVLAVAVALVAPSVVTLWVWTPSGADIEERVHAVATERGVPVLAEDQVPTQLADAVVAIEDERFYQHHGVDTIGLARSVLYDVSNVCLCQGGSTITEQLVKDVYLGGSDRGRNKLYDMALAFKAEGVLSKSRIMADYLSEITTGFGIYGVTAAACAYFHAPLSRLTLGQYALLAGVTQAPSVYDPRNDPEAAKDRRSEALAQMVVAHYISAADERAANAEPVLTSGPGC